MTEPIPVYCEQAYAVLYNRFGGQQFSPGYFRWFLPDSTTKKILHLLEKKGWIKRVKRGQYICNDPEKIIKSMVGFKVPDLLAAAGKKYCYTKMSAVEVWTSYTYMQRSWEHSPYFAKILKKDAKFWTSYFKSHNIRVFIKSAKPAIGEFVVLIPEEDFYYETIDDKPADKLKEVIEFCKNNIDMYEYPLAYLVKKFKLKTTADIDQRVMEAV